MINFYSQNTAFKLTNKCLLKNWISIICTNNNRKLGTLNYLFCDDQYILEANIKYLGHSYYTDIITFDTSDYDVHSSKLSGDLIISIDTVKANSVTYKVPFNQELYRVIIHGVLHLIGYDDLTKEDQLIMRSKEDEALNILKTLK